MDSKRYFGRNNQAAQQKPDWRTVLTSAGGWEGEVRQPARDWDDFAYPAGGIGAETICLSQSAKLSQKSEAFTGSRRKPFKRAMTGAARQVPYVNAGSASSPSTLCTGSGSRPLRIAKNE